MRTSFSLHQTALQQAATDPITGKIDVSILVTGISTAARQRRAQLAGQLRDYLQTKLGPGTFSSVKVFEEFKAVCKMVIFLVIFFVIFW